MNSQQSSPAAQASSGKKSFYKKLLWSILFLLIAATSIWAVSSQMKEESLADLGRSLAGLKPWWIIAAIFSMFCYIASEGLAIHAGCRALGITPKRKHTLDYSAADIYFSAITPSATGGQPASVVLMMQDGISGIAATAILLINLTMCTLATIVIGILCFSFKVSIFHNFGTTAQIFITVGFALQLVLATCLYLLIRHENILKGICSGFISLGAKVGIVKNKESSLSNLAQKIHRYKETIQMVTGKKKYLLSMFLCNVLQRASQVAVTSFVFLAMGLGGATGPDIWALQGYVLLGSNYVPIPGGMGITDYLLLDGFGAILPSSAAAQLDLLSRSLSFYLCILLCGGALLARWIYRSRKKYRTETC